jgi:hypothetical protein
MPVGAYAGKAHLFALRFICAGHRRRRAEEREI